MKKQKIIITFIILIFLLPMQSKALNDTNTLINTENEEKTESTTKITQEDIEKQEETFGINSFIQNSKQYTGDFFENIDINEILNSAIKGEIDNTTIYKKILNLLGTEVQTGLKSLACILAIIIIHSILKSISESLENDSVSKLIYYVQYILIITIIMTNFSEIIKRYNSNSKKKITVHIRL